MSDNVLFGEVVNFLNSKRKPLSSKQRENRKGIFPYYGASDIVDYIDDYIFDGRYLLISEDGENLKSRKTPIAFIAQGKFWVNNHAHIIEGYDDESIDYLRYYFSAFNLTPYLTGAVQPKLSKKVLEKIEIKFPSYERRKFINETLGILDKKIQLNTETNQTLEAIAQALFKSWFIDFDPVRAKADALANGKTKTQATIEAMKIISGKTTDQLTQLAQDNPKDYQQLQTTAEAFPSGFNDTGIPLGWEMSTIGEEAETVGGATPSTKNADFWDNGDIHWTTPKDLSGLADKILIDTDRKVTKQGLAKISSGLLPVDTVLMSSRAPVGYLALAKIPVAINQGYIAMKCKKRLSPFYVLQWCYANMDEIKMRSSGTTFKEISKKNFRTIECIVPNQEVLHLFSGELSNLYKKIEVNVKENNLLSESRDILLPKLLNGEIDV